MIEKPKQENAIKKIHRKLVKIHFSIVSYPNAVRHVFDWYQRDDTVAKLFYYFNVFVCKILCVFDCLEKQFIGNIMIHNGALEVDVNMTQPDSHDSNHRQFNKTPIKYKSM